MPDRIDPRPPSPGLAADLVAGDLDRAHSHTRELIDDLGCLQALASRAQPAEGERETLRLLAVFFAKCLRNISNGSISNLWQVHVALTATRSGRGPSWVGCVCASSTSLAVQHLAFVVVGFLEEIPDFLQVIDRKTWETLALEEQAEQGNHLRLGHSCEGCRGLIRHPRSKLRADEVDVPALMKWVAHFLQGFDHDQAQADAEIEFAAATAARRALQPPSPGARAAKDPSPSLPAGFSWERCLKQFSGRRMLQRKLILALMDQRPKTTDQLLELVYGEDVDDNEEALRKLIGRTNDRLLELHILFRIQRREEGWQMIPTART